MADKKRRKSENFMRQFRDITSSDITTINAVQLLMIWDHYDRDANGYIENEELDKFLREFVSSVCRTDASDEVLSETMMTELKTDFMDAYDENGDGKIEIRELAQLLPTDENFLLLFQLDNRLHSSVDFMTIWKKYDRDNNGSIDANELKSFLKDFITIGNPQRQLSDDKLAEYSAAIIKIFDANKDGKLQLNEMARLLPVKENTVKAVLTSKVMKDTRKVEHADVDRIFEAYDVDNSGELEGDEITGFVKDFMDLLKPNYSAQDLNEFQTTMLKACDLDGDGKISRQELTLFLFGLQHFQKAS